MRGGVREARIFLRMATLKRREGTVTQGENGKGTEEKKVMR